MSEKIRGFVDRAKEAVESGELKEKAVGIVEDVKEKATPVVNKVRDVASDAVDAVKDGVNRLAGAEKPPLNVNNELFDALGAEVAEQRDAVADKAAEMQRKIEEMLGGKE